MTVEEKMQQEYYTGDMKPMLDFLIESMDEYLENDDSLKDNPNYFVITFNGQTFVIPFGDSSQHDMVDLLKELISLEG